MSTVDLSLVAGETGGRRGLRALVVEDNLTNQEVARLMLGGSGVVADIAPDGAVALQQVASERYDIILMDMQMPGDDGATVTRKMRAAGIRIPIVALTANALVTDREHCLAAGMDDFLSKPVTYERMRQMLDRWLPDRGRMPDGVTCAIDTARPERGASEGDAPEKDAPEKDARSGGPDRLVVAIRSEGSPARPPLASGPRQDKA